VTNQEIVATVAQQVATCTKSWFATGWSSGLAATCLGVSALMTVRQTYSPSNHQAFHMMN